MRELRTSLMRVAKQSAIPRLEKGIRGEEPLTAPVVSAIKLVLDKVLPTVTESHNTLEITEKPAQELTDAELAIIASGRARLVASDDDPLPKGVKVIQHQPLSPAQASQPSGFEDAEGLEEALETLK